MSQERRSSRSRPPAANPAVEGGNIILTHDQFERLINIAQNNQTIVAGNQPVANNDESAVPIPFALSPALVNMAKPINFTTSEGNKLNKAAVSALPYKFDVESQSINTFNEILMDRCITLEWNDPAADILSVDVNGKNYNLIHDYGQLTMKDIRTHCASYMTSRTRKAQHQFQMYQCLMVSLANMQELLQE